MKRSPSSTSYLRFLPHGFTFLIVLFVIPVYAVPPIFSYQGRIVKSDGTPLEYQSVSFEFSITSPDGTCILYREQKNGLDMRNSRGLFDTPIGLGTQIFPTSPSVGLKDIFKNTGVLNCEGGLTYTPTIDDGRRLRTQFHDGVGWQLITPDNIIRSIPYAVQSLAASTAETAQKLGSYSSTDFVLKNGVPVCGAGDFLTSSSLGVLSCATPSSSGGSVTNIATGTGLTGGPITSSGTISIANGGVGVLELAANAVTTAKISDGNVTGAKLETLSGLSAGTYGSATVVPSITVDTKGRVTSVSSNNLNIHFSDIKNISGTSAFNVGSCTANQTVAWSALTDMFTCQNIGSLDASTITTGIIDASRLPPSVTDGLWTAASGNAYRSTGHVGIGTNDPQTTLHLAGTGLRVTGTSDANENPTGSDRIDIGMVNGTGRIILEDDSASATWQIGTVMGSLNLFSNNVNTQFSIWSSGTERFRIDTNGNVGVGTGTPSEKLEVNGTIKGTQVCIGTDCRAAWPSAGSGGTVTSVTAGTGLVTIPGGGITTSGSIGIASGGVSATELSSNAVTTVKILDGNVTGAKLETLAGLTAGSYGSATAVPTVSVDTKGRITAIATNNITGLLPTASGVGGKYLKSDGTNWAAQDVRFSDIKNISGTSAFNVGSCAANQTVAWSSLTDTFTCQNIGSLDASTITTGTLNTARLPTSVTDGLWSASSGNVYRSTGNVGIGTNSPNVPLTVLKDGLNATGSMYVVAGFDNSANNKGVWLGYNSSGTIGLIGSDSGGASSSLAFVTANSSGVPVERARIDGSGNVGIGTINPTSKLHIYGSNPGLTVESSAGSDPEIWLNGPAAQTRRMGFRTNGNNRWTINASSTTESGSNTGSDFSIYRFNDAGSYVDAPLTISRSTGNIGIGTTTPTNRLEVVGGTTKLEQEPWTYPSSLGASWVNYGGGWSVFGYRKDSMGYLRLRGLIKNGTTGTTFFTLPVGYRPATALEFSISTPGTSSGVPGTANVIINTNGNMTVESMTSNTWISFDNVSLPLD